MLKSEACCCGGGGDTSARDLCSVLASHVLMSRHLLEQNEAGTEGRSSRQNLYDIRTQEDCYLSCSLDIGLEAAGEKDRVLLTCFSLKIPHLTCLSHGLAAKSGRGKEKKSKNCGQWCEVTNQVTEDVSIWGESGKKTWEHTKPGRFFWSKV